MSETETLEFILHVFKIFNSFGGPPNDDLWWRTDGEYAPVTFLINCNDMFWLACADSEPLTPENLHVLQSSIADAESAYADYARANATEKEFMGVDPEKAVKLATDLANIHATALFCARVRKMRPQGAYYRHIPSALWSLFDGCGPERAVDKTDPANTPKPAHDAA